MALKVHSQRARVHEEQMQDGHAREKVQAPLLCEVKTILSKRKHGWNRPWPV